MSDPGRFRIDSIYDFTERGKAELIAELQKWFRTRRAAPADIGPIDSTENVGSPWGVQSRETPAVPEAPGQVLRTTGDGGSEWGPPPSILVVPSLDQLLLAVMAGGAGWWKLNESSGLVAADSSGNGLDLTDDYAAYPPLWGQTAGPPGEQAADFDNGVAGHPGQYARVARSWAAITGSFTAGIWVKRPSTTYSTVMGQGNPGRGGGKGWQIALETTGNGNKPSVTAVGLGVIYANAALGSGTWAFLCVRVSGTTWTFFVDGVAQTGTLSGSYTSVTTSSPLWIGHDGGLGGSDLQEPFFTGSYGFYIPSALSDGQIAAIYSAAGQNLLVDADKVPLADGSGSITWDYAMKVDGTRYDEILTGTNLSSTDNSDGTVTIDASGGGGAVASDVIWDAKGDLAVASGADAASKLPVGSNDDVLTADSGQTLGVKWAARIKSLAKSGSTALSGDVTLSAGSGISLTQSSNDIQIAASGGGMVKLYDYTVTGSDKASIDTNVDDGGNGAAGISTSYGVLYIDIYSRTDESVANSGIYLQFNNDSGVSNYITHDMHTSNATVSGGSLSTAAGCLLVTSGDTNTASVFGALHATLPAYAGTVGQKSLVAMGGTGSDSAGNTYTFERICRWKSTSAISRVSLSVVTSAKKLKVGTRIVIYGG